jgi:hypothetical protein
MNLISLGHPFIVTLPVADHDCSIPNQPGFDRLHAPKDIRFGTVHLSAEIVSFRLRIEEHLAQNLASAPLHAAP